MDSETLREAWAFDFEAKCPLSGPGRLFAFAHYMPSSEAPATAVSHEPRTRILAAADGKPRKARARPGADLRPPPRTLNDDATHAPAPVAAPRSRGPPRSG